MFKHPGSAIRLAVLGLVLVGIVAVFGAPPGSGDTGTPPLPTLMSLPTQLPTDRPDPTPIPAVIEPTVLPPTQALAAAPTSVPPSATQLLQPTVKPLTEVISSPPTQPVPNQLTIQFAPGTSPEQQAAYVNQLGGAIEQTIAPLNTVVVTIPDVAARQTPLQSPIVVQVEPDYYVTAQQSTPDDPYYSQQWALPAISAPDAWALLPANLPTIAVAVIDSGICASHPDLSGRILPGYDFVQDDSTPQDEFGHGCGVSGIIAANTNNSLGIAGVAPNARIMPLRVLDAGGVGTYSRVAAAMIYAADNGARIINLSLGGANPSSTLQNAVNYAVGRGVLVIAAAGNTGGAVIYPAAYAEVVAVASVDQSLTRSSFSSFGPQVDLLAPGRDIMTTRLDGSYAPMTGTSFAAPQVAGIAALEMAQGRSLVQDGGLARVSTPAAPTPMPTSSPVAQPGKNGQPNVPDTAPISTDTWAVSLTPGSDPNTTAAQFGYENLGQIGTLPDTYLFRVPNTGTSLQAAQQTAIALQSIPNVVWFEQQLIIEQFPRIISDPQYPNQWHLDPGSAVNQGANVKDAWAAGYDGTGIVIAIVDDGLQWTTYDTQQSPQPLNPHPDLAPNFVASGSHNYNGGKYGVDDPAPSIGTDCNPGSIDPANCHGTAAAGVAAAADDGTSCGVGVAYNAGVSGIRLIAQPHSTNDEAAALTFQNQINDIFNNSWGPADHVPYPPNPQFEVVGPLAPLSETVRFALQTGITSGRGGLGNIYVWAAGNGLQFGDDVNADGYANSRYVIAVGATDYHGDQSYYSEPGAAMFVTAPSNGSSGPSITTSDLIGDTSPGYSTGDCTSGFGGTSAAAPLVSGVVALMLDANPDLNWRDVKYILAQTAEQNDPSDSDWETNAAGYHINHKYGFGRVDAAAAVNLAATWTSVSPELSATHPDPDPSTPALEPITVNQPIPSVVEGGGYSSSTVINANLNVETVEVILNAAHTYIGDLEVILTSPSGTKSRMIWRPDDYRANFTNWKMTTVRNWGEHSAGTWTLTVVDRFPDSYSGTFQNWQLVVYGTAAPLKQPVPVAPANGTTIDALPLLTPVTFMWDMDATFGADHLELQVDTVNPPVSEPIVPDGVPNSYLDNLAPGQYSWRVRAIAAGGETVDWEDIPALNFTVSTSNNQSPARNYYTTGAPVLTWTPLTWATGYQVEISTSPTFALGSEVLLTSPDAPILPGELSFTVAPPLGEGIYYWRVRGRKADGTWSATWSTTDSFVIDL